MSPVEPPLVSKYMYQLPSFADEGPVPEDCVLPLSRVQAADELSIDTFVQLQMLEASNEQSAALSKWILGFSMKGGRVMLA